MKILNLLRFAKNHKRTSHIEFSKKLVVWALTITTLSIGLSYALAFFERDTCSDITIAIVTTCIAIAVGYEAKSFGEKNSRNKYGIDLNGFNSNCKVINENESSSSDVKLEETGNDSISDEDAVG